MPRRTFLALFLATALAVPALAANKSRTASPESLAHSITIYRDNYGVPHVFGPTDASCVFGFIYAQAEDNFWQIEDSYIRSLGRAAEIYGEKAFNDDKMVRALGIPKLARAEYERSPARVKELAAASADGLNYFLEHNQQGVKARLLTHFEPWYVFAFNRYALYYQFIFRQSGIQPAEIDTAAQTQGSNMWAVSPAKTATGHAMLFINPHQPFFGVGQWYEGHVHSDEGWDLSGASFFGSGFPTIGHNESLGWSHTVNRPDIIDVYEETFDKPADPLAYKYDKGYRKATEWTDQIAVKTDKGLITRSVTFRGTHHGPIVAKRNGKSLAVKMAKFEEGGQVGEWYAMGKAQSLAEFKAALDQLAVPMFNTMYADKQGNIFYIYTGAVPRRATNFDWLKPVDGSNAETEWQGYHPIADLPQLTNPKTNWLQNCNSTPFATTSEGNPDASQFPSYMVGESDTARARISRRILSTTKQFSFDDWARAGYDTQVITADELLPGLLEKVDKSGNAKLAPVADVLRGWDHKSGADSVAMTVYLMWFEKHYGTAVIPGKATKDKDPVQSLADGVAHLEKVFGTWKVPFGDLNRLERTQSGGEEPFSDALPSLPVAGAPGDLGIVFNFYARPERGQKRRYGVAGHSFVSVVDFGPKVEARSILVFGENSDPKSPHYFDQSELYAKQQFKPAWFYLADIKSHAEQTYHPGEKH